MKEESQEENEIIACDCMICFLPEEKPAGNFFKQAMQIVLKKYCERNSFLIKEKNLQILFVPDFSNEIQGKRLFQRMLTYKRENNLKQKEQTMQNARLFAYQMKDKEDLPPAIYRYFSLLFLNAAQYDKNTKVVLIAGECLKPTDLMALIEFLAKKVNYLTIYLAEDADREEYETKLSELLEKVEEEYGLLIFLTRQKNAVLDADMILDGSRKNLYVSGKTHEGAQYFLLDGSRNKRKSIRKIKGLKNAPKSCSMCLDRAFHNKV